MGPRVGWLVVAALAAGGLVGVVAAGADPQTTPVTAQNFSFTQPSVTVAVGDTVKWGLGGGTHTTHAVAGQGESWDSGDLTGSGFTHTFTHAGTFKYYCAHHGSVDGGSGMVGTVVVQDAGSTTTSTSTSTSTTTAPTATPPTTEPPPPPSETPTVAFTASALDATRKGVVPVEIGNPHAFAITGQVRLDTAKAVSVARRKKLKLGGARFSVPAAGKVVAKVKLTKAARKLLTKRGKLSVKVTIVSRAPGGDTKTSARTVTLVS
jgi:plastocyanin